MSGRNLKIRITVGRDSQQAGATNNASDASASAQQSSKPLNTQILIAGITCLAVIVGTAWIFLSGHDEPQTTAQLAATNETTKPGEPFAVTAPQHANAGAIGVVDTAMIANAASDKPTASASENSDQPRTQEREQATTKTKTNAVDDKKPTKIVKTTGQTGRITRAILTSAVIHREPIDKLNKAVVAPDKPKPLFYFTEIVDMKGTTLTHRWRHEGKVVADMKFRIGSDHYRVYSNKQMRADSKGNWQIEVLDQNGRTLQTAHFTYQ